ncbi:MAG TPA: hydrogenase nickel incorporation protein HypB [Oligoflexia bacterium]|nr:hydrogenase nickel incorporation protein HypB [Oligoflexia bacterium]
MNDLHAKDNIVTRSVKVETSVLRRNDQAALANRQLLTERGIVALNLISSPGSGKTTLLEVTLVRMRERGKRCAVIVGDQQTDLDAQRLYGKGAPVRQIETVSSCHLDAQRVGDVLPEVIDDQTELLFIENVGNLICPAAFNLGEDFKVVLLSVTEGEDKPIKYPVVFSRAKVVLITKCDLIPHIEFDRDKCLRYLRQVNPGAVIFELSAKTGTGFEQWIGYLAELGRQDER